MTESILRCSGCGSTFSGDEYGESVDFDHHKCPSIRTRARTASENAAAAQAARKRLEENQNPEKGRKTR